MAQPNFANLKPVSTSTNQPNFSALKPGAFPKEIPPAVHQSFMQKLGSSLIDPLKGGIKNVQNAGNQISDAFKGGLDYGRQGVNEIGQGSSNPLQAAGNLVEGASKVAGGFTQSLFSPLAPVLNPTLGKATDYVANKIADVPAVQKFADSKAGQATSKVVETAANYNNFAGVVGGAMEDTPKIEKAGAALQDVADRVVGKKAVANDIATKTASDAVKAPKVTGQIVQGDIADIPKAQKALSQIDISKVKTYQDLGNALDSKISDVSKLQDKAYDTRPAPIHLEDLTSQGHNFVKDAIDQLNDFYTKTNDIAGQKEMQALAQKAQTQGLTLKEVNQLARDHGATLNAYNANGELASGLTKQAAENTRQGLKSTTRTFMGDKALEGSDAQLSDLIRTKKLVGEVSEKVNTLAQKIQERGVLAKIGYGVGKVIDTATGHALKNFVNYFIPRGEGLKTLNALDLEKMLNDNLSSLQKLTEGKMSNADFTSQLNELIKKGNPQKLLPEPKVGSPKASVDVPLEQPSKVVSSTAEQARQNVQRVGGKGSTRLTQLKEGQISAPAVKRGSYKNMKAYKARVLQRVVEDTKKITK